MGAEEKVLGQRLQQARRQVGLTQQQLCQKAGLSYSTLAKIERGAIKAPSVFTVASIADITGTSVEELLGSTARPNAPTDSKKTSKSGIKFVYFDVNSVLLRFYQKAFSEIGEQCNQPVDAVEALYWRYNDQVSTGKITLAEFNKKFSDAFGLDGFDWQQYYIANSEPMPGIGEFAAWVAKHYEIGLMSNNMPGFIDALRHKNVIPNLEYKAVIDSSQAGCLKPDTKIYQIAEQKAGVNPNEILLIDDNRAFLTAADRQGWQITWFNELDPSESISRAKSHLEF